MLGCTALLNVTVSPVPTGTLVWPFSGVVAVTLGATGSAVGV